MFRLNLILKEIHTDQIVNFPIRLYVYTQHSHFSISEKINIASCCTPINLNARVELSQSNPIFELKIIAYKDTRYKQLGNIILDARQWPLDEQKIVNLRFPFSIQINGLVRNQFILDEISEVSQFQRQAKSVQLSQLLKQAIDSNTRLKEANYIAKQQIIKQAQSTIQLERQLKLKYESSEHLSIGCQIKKSQLQQQLSQLQGQLAKVNEQLGSLLNLVSQHGDPKICSQILEFLEIQGLRNNESKQNVKNETQITPQAEKQQQK